MNERELKVRFWDAFRTGAIKGAGRGGIPVPGKDTELRVVEEGNFRAFDLVVAEVGLSGASPSIDNAANILSRTALYYSVALEQKCRIDRLRLFPVELKSDSDAIDARLARQVACALFTFGSSIVVLDQKHAKKIGSSAFCKALPATIIARTGSEFEVLSEFNPGMASSALQFDKKSLARLLSDFGGISSDRLARRLNLLQLVLQKLAYSQLYSESIALDGRELEFLRNIVACDMASKRELVKALLKETVNAKLTDFCMADGSD